MTDVSKPNWHDAFPGPRATAPIITREEALPSLGSDELLLVDVRRTDFEGGTIKGSINLPAHSFYMNRAVLFDLCKRAGVRKVAFYCGKQCIPIHSPRIVCVVACIWREHSITCLHATLPS